MSRWAERAVLVTGASGGIGAVTASLFRANGWRVAAAVRDPAKVVPPAAGDGGFAVVRMDVTDEASVRRGVDEAVGRFGRLDAVVNNAGYALNGPVEGLTAEQVGRQFATNVGGVLAVTRAALPALRAAGGGVIVNVSSVGGRVAFPFAATYNATKFAVEGLSESLRYELAAHRVRVKVVEPGGIRTGFIGAIEWGRHPAYEPQLSEFVAMSDRLNANLPGPEGVAKVIYRAATDRSGRLRYPALAGPYLMLHRLLPDWVWRRLVGSMLRGHAGRSKAAAQPVSRPAGTR